MTADDDKPVISGLLALLVVATLVGGIAAGGVLFVTNKLGLDDGQLALTSGNDTLYMPPLEPTPTPTEPLITLETEGSSPSASASPSPSQRPTKTPTQKPTKKKQKHQITLSASPLTVDEMERIYLTGIYPGGEGSVLQVQRLVNGEWEDFPVTVTVTNETFSTYVQTGRTGMNKFRVADTGSSRVSNPVTITVR